MKSFYAVSIYGQGHIMAYNRVRGFHDGLDHATYGMPDDYPNTPRDRLPVAIDIYNNDVSVVHDNCFETDGSVRNIRVMRNRCFNAVLGAMSPQPVFGGPVYFIRNVVYNAWWGPVKIHGEPSGIYYLNNTYVGEFKQLTPASNLHPAEQSDHGAGHAAARVLAGHVHELQQLGLQRLPPESRIEGGVRVELAAVRRGAQISIPRTRQPRCAGGRSARAARIPDAQGVREGHRAGLVTAGWSTTTSSSTRRSRISRTRRVSCRWNRWTCALRKARPRSMRASRCRT